MVAYFLNDFKYFQIISEFYYTRTTKYVELFKLKYPNKHLQKQGNFNDTFEDCVRKKHHSCDFSQNVKKHVTQIGMICGHEKVSE